jgi:hypothetical protein
MQDSMGKVFVDKTNNRKKLVKKPDYISERDQVCALYTLDIGVKLNNPLPSAKLVQM